MGFDKNIVGIVGPIACGKGILVDFLKEKYGYTSFSLSSILHEELKKQGITRFTRTTLQDLGDELRKKEGDEVLAKRAIKRLKERESYNAKRATHNVTRYTLHDKRTIIEGIRNPGEVEYLRTIPGFFLIAVDATQEIRFQRVLTRAKPWDPKNWNEFLKVDKRDRGDGGDKGGQQVKKCMEMADVKIENNGDKEAIFIAIQYLALQ